MPTEEVLVSPFTPAAMVNKRTERFAIHTARMDLAVLVLFAGRIAQMDSPIQEQIVLSLHLTEEEPVTPPNPPAKRVMDTVRNGVFCGTLNVETVFTTLPVVFALLIVLRAWSTSECPARSTPMVELLENH